MLCSNFDDELRAFGLPAPFEVARKRVIVMTCGAAGILRSGDYLRYYERELEHGKIKTPTSTTSLEFTHVLIDEAGQVSLFIMTLSQHKLGSVQKLIIAAYTEQCSMILEYSVLWFFNHFESFNYLVFTQRN